MEVQIKSLAENSNLQMIALGTLATNGILHLSFGAAYISAGHPLSMITLASLIASDNGVKALGGYMIICGLYMMAASLGIYWNLAKNRVSAKMSVMSWLLTVVACFFTFTAAVLASQVYTPISRYLAAYGVSVSDYGSQISNMFNFALADSIITFAIGWPASIYLLVAGSYHRTKVGTQNQDSVVDANIKQREIATDLQDNANRYQRDSPGEKTIDLQRQTYGTPYERRIEGQVQLTYSSHGEVISNTEHLAQEGQRSPERVREMSPENRDQTRLRIDTKIAKAQPIYSSPNFAVEMPQMPRRSMYLRQAELPQATVPKSFIS